MPDKVYVGINIQWPISERILEGSKTVETRTYPIPQKYLNQEMLLIETPGKTGKFKARARGIIVFTDCFRYRSSSEFYEDISRHQVTEDSKWAWVQKPKWGWRVKILKVFKNPKIITTKRGIIFTLGLKI